MNVDPSVLQSIQKSVEADPESVPLRLYLARLYLHGNQPEEALLHFQEALKRDAANTEALQGAASAAASLGQTALANQYRDQSAKLGSSTETPVPPTQPAEPAGKQRITPEGQLEHGEDDNPDLDDPSMPKITLADVGGMETVKKRINLAFLAPLKNPKMREVYGKSMRGGLLLYGPPGCGKTFIARAVAGELGAKFMNVGLTDVLGMWFAESEQKLHALFENARRSAPVVLFFDEVDALGHKRSEMRGNNAGRNIVNQLLSELDGVASNNTGVFILAATNHPWDVDTALRRPGRFDRMALVLPPDEKARESILRYHLKAKPAETIDPAWLAKLTVDFSGADLAYLVESATEVAMEESLESGIVRPLKSDDFKKPLKDIKPSTRSWFETAKNYALFANEGGTYDDLLEYMRARKLV